MSPGGRAGLFGMARTSTYLNFPGTTEEAFNFYRGVFGTEFPGPIVRMREVPCGGAPLSASEADNVMLPILGGHVLMGTDAPESMPGRLVFGTNVSINLEPDSREETERLFAALAAGGKVEMALQAMFWGGTFGSLTDRFGVQWMFNFQPGAAQNFF
jgi:PhnB protein